MLKLTVLAAFGLFTLSFGAVFVDHSDPIVPLLGESKGGEIDRETFLAEEGLSLVYDEKKTSCAITSFDLVMVPKQNDAVLSKNPGGNYTAASRSLVQRAKTGDLYYFNSVMVKCTGDTEARSVGTLYFKIK